VNVPCEPAPPNHPPLIIYNPSCAVIVFLLYTPAPYDIPPRMAFFRAAVLASLRRSWTEEEKTAPASSDKRPTRPVARACRCTTRATTKTARTTPQCRVVFLTRVRNGLNARCAPGGRKLFHTHSTACAMCALAGPFVGGRCRPGNHGGVSLVFMSGGRHGKLDYSGGAVS
jgi:hypothetical protein